MTDLLVQEIGRAVESLSDGALDRLEAGLRSGASDYSIVDAVSHEAFRVRARALLAARDAAGAENGAIVLAMAAARDRQRTRASERISLVWTGPDTGLIPIRRTDQVLLQVIAEAEEQIIVVSYTVYDIGQVAGALVACASRRCDVVIVVESDVESGRNVGYSMVKQFGPEVAKHARFFTWPAEARPQAPNGKLASLHAKCAVADHRLLLVSSANLTDRALTMNMEFGVLIEGGDAPQTAHQHFLRLIETNALREIR